MSPTCPSGRSRSERTGRLARGSLLCLATLASALVASACSGRLSGNHSATSDGGSSVPPPDDAVPAEPGLLSVVAGAHAVLIRWRGIGDVSPGSGAGVLALFGGLDPATVYAQPPFLTAPAGESLVVEGLPAGTTVWLGLGFSSDGGATWKPIGPRLSATTRAPLYVDAAASGAVVDGLT